MHGRILIIDDDQSMCEMLEADLRRRGFDPSWYTSAGEAFENIKNKDFDVILTDLRLPGMNGIELCERIAANRSDVPVVVMTAFGSIEAAVDAMRAGAYDFVAKPIDLDILALCLQRALKHRRLQEQVRTLSESVKRFHSYDEIIGNSPPMQKLFAQLDRLADSEASVLITGESGTGKELIARALHRQKRQESAPFIAVSCSALPETLLESELFGYKRGAFTDAKKDHKGLFLQADGGTLFLDEIGEMPVLLQPKLLRALEERSVRPIGGNSEHSFDVRLVSATNLDLESAVEEGRFREDLFYRLNVIRVEVPPLRERGTDILLLAQHYIKYFAGRSGKKVDGITDKAAEELLTYDWHGNVRELRNAVEHAVVLTRFDKITVEDLPKKIRAYQNDHILISGHNPAELVSMEEVEGRYILHVLKTVGDNRTLAARVLGLDRKTLYRKLRRYDAE
jgi:DNA-binding NtrC family response regulator